MVYPASLFICFIKKLKTAQKLKFSWWFTRKLSEKYSLNKNMQNMQNKNTI